MAILLFREKFPDFGFIETPKDQPADIDGLIHKGTTLVSGVEVKCRNMTASELSGRFNNRWLITSDKLDRGIALCRSLGIDFRGFLYLVPDDLLLIVPIWTMKDGMVADIELDQTRTQATVNGGEALRLNAFVDMSRAKAIARL